MIFSWIYKRSTVVTCDVTFKFLCHLNRLLSVKKSFSIKTGWVYVPNDMLHTIKSNGSFFGWFKKSHKHHSSWLYFINTSPFLQLGVLSPYMAYVCEDGLLNYFKLHLLSQCFVDTQENQNQDNNETSTESNNKGHVSMEMESSAEVT